MTSRHKGTMRLQDDPRLDGHRSTLTFYPLQNLNQAVKISVQISKRCQQKMHMVGHHDNGMNHRLRSLIMQTVPQHNVSGRFRQRIEAAAKGNKRRPIVFLIVRQPPSIFVLPLQQCLSHRNMGMCVCVERAPSPAAFDFRSLPEKTKSICDTDTIEM